LDGGGGVPLYITVSVFWRNPLPLPSEEKSEAEGSMLDRNAGSFLTEHLVSHLRISSSSSSSLYAGRAVIPGYVSAGSESHIFLSFVQGGVFIFSEILPFVGL
jgi:hypothetical protein